jgi:hypothetical protein
LSDKNCGILQIIQIVIQAKSLDFLGMPGMGLGATRFNLLQEPDKTGFAVLALSIGAERCDNAAVQVLDA